MGLNANNVQGSSSGSKSTAPQIESGSYIARVVQVLDLGMQNQRPYLGEEKPPANELLITYELGTEFMLDEDGKEMTDKPLWVSETIPLHSLQVDLAKSTKRMKALDPDNALGGDFGQLVGKACTLTVKANEGKGKYAGRTFTNVVGVAPPMKGMPVPEVVGTQKVFNLDTPDLEVFNSLPDWLKDKIKGNLEYNGSSLRRLLGGEEAQPAPKPEAPATAEYEDDIPF